MVMMSGGADVVRRLAELAGVPMNAGRVFDWPALEGELGVRLPSDYKVLAESFPRGWFRNFVSVLPPTGTDREMSLIEYARGELDALRELRESGEASFPYPLFPEPNGVLPWGYIVTAGIACWLTGQGKPDEWPVVLATEDGDYWDRFNGSASEFLISVVTASYDASGFTEGPDINDRQRGERPIELASRPVFEPDTPARPAFVSWQTVPPEDFWIRRLEQVGGPVPAVNELATVREIAGSPPPSVPSVDWEAVHARLGFPLPADYRTFINEYGPGTLGDIRIMSPGARAEWDLFALLERKYEQVRYAPRGEWDPPWYPEPRGTVGWGETVSGWTCGWAPIDSDPDKWTVIAVAPSPQLNALRFQAGVSFTTALRRHVAFRGPGQEHEVIPSRDPSSGPFGFIPALTARQSMSSIRAVTVAMMLVGVAKAMAGGGCGGWRRRRGG